MALHLGVAAAIAGGLFYLGSVQHSIGAMFIGVGLAGVYLAFTLRRPYRRWVGLRTPLSEEAKAALERVRFYRLLDEAGQAKFARRVQILLAEYDFESVGGATLDDEIKVLAVAGAAVLVHHLERPELPARRSILIYPDRFDDQYQGHGKGNILGMVHHQGPIIFSAKALRRGWKADTDGHNVSIHEFAHVLDLMDGFADGVPDVGVDGWDETVKEELLRVRKGRSVLRDYAGTNHAELFAVGVEVFFERPHRLAERHPELYERFVEFFGVDPRTLSHREEAAAKTERTGKKRKKKKRRRR